jgi:hypothetical protein
MGEPTLYVVSTERRLLQLGVTLFLLGLLTGFSLPLLENPRMGLASHLEGVLNGLLLILLGLVWPPLTLTRTQARLSFAFLVYGTFANWVATLLAALWGAGRCPSQPPAMRALPGRMACSTCCCIRCQLPWWRLWRSCSGGFVGTARTSGRCAARSRDRSATARSEWQCDAYSETDRSRPSIRLDPSVEKAGRGGLGVREVIAARWVGSRQNGLTCSLLMCGRAPGAEAV